MMKEILITSTALILALLLIRRVFRGVLSRRFQYALWGLVLAVSAFALGLAAYQGTEPSLLLPTAAALLVFVLWPLRHGRDGMELCRGGVVYRSKFYPAGGRVAWRGVNTVFLSSTYLHLGQKKGINVSFMKDAEKLFARAYSNVIT